MDLKNNLKLRKNWKQYNEFESRYRKEFLKGLSRKRSFEIFQQLYDYASLFKASEFSPADQEHLKNLARVHALFGKVKS